jgi:glutathione S-transferase
VVAKYLEGAIFAEYQGTCTASRLQPCSSWELINLHTQGLSYSTEFLSFVEINNTLNEIVPGIPENKVPVLIHDGKAIQESYEIAKYLDRQFPEPSLLHSQEGVHRYLTAHIETEIAPLISKMVGLKVYGNLDEENKNYYRSSREARYKDTLENFAGDQEDNFHEFVQKFQLIERMLGQFAWISGSELGWADIVTASLLIFLESFQPERHNQLLSIYPNAANWQKKMNQYKQANNQ